MRSEAAPHILLVDDDPQSLGSTRKILEGAEYAVESASDGQEALTRIQAAERPFSLVVSDLRMPRMGGLEFLKALRAIRHDTPVVLMTAFGNVEDAVWAMKFGAVDFLTKPFKRQALLDAVKLALTRARAQLPIRPEGAASLLRGQSVAMRELRALTERVAPTLATVLITGESGTGKERVAHALHGQSPRASRPFIAINCAALPENLMEAELFGWERGAFTGAIDAKPGLFEAASEGTLFLDEIGDMPLALQAKLLRVIQEGEVRRLGATRAVKLQVRLVAATHQDLREAVRAGRFREDLLYRLEVIAVHIPPLRERPEDIPDLCYEFLARASERHGIVVRGMEDAVMEALLAYPWPGNARELSNVLERAVVLSQGPLLQASALPEHVLAAAASPSAEVSEKKLRLQGAIELPLGTSLKDAEDLLIARTLEATEGDKNVAAKLLGVNSRTLYRWLDSQKRPADEGSRTPTPPPFEPKTDPTLSAGGPSDSAPEV